MTVLVGLPGESSREECKTIEVGAFGALLVLVRHLEVGQMLLLTNPKSLKEITCYVRSVKQKGPGLNHVGVDFAIESSKFWGMTFPSGDWDPSERKRPQRPLAPGDPSFRALPGHFAGYSSKDAPRTEPGTNSNAEIRKVPVEIAESLAKPSMEPLCEPEPGGVPEPETTQKEKTIESAGNGDARETTRVNTPVVRKSTRRGPRVHLEVSVLVGFPGEPSYEKCKTIEIGAFGALLVVARQFDVGQMLLLTNSKSLKQISCQVRNVKEKGPCEIHVGVEFASESSKFWGMTFPSSDWDPSERKRLQRPLSSSSPSFRTFPGQSEAQTGEDQQAAPQPIPTRWSVLKRPVLIFAGFLALILCFAAFLHKPNTDSTAGVRSIYQDVAAEEARLIPDIEKYRLATLDDFNPDAVSWLRDSGQQVTGQVSGSFSSFGQSRIYLLIGKNNIWRIVILANGQLRCDAQYRAVAIVARVPKLSIRKIDWADPPPADSEGDGLLVVRAADDFGTSVVLLLRGDQVVSGTPSDYRKIPFDQTP
jgi:hypothetical protein